MRSNKYIDMQTRKPCQMFLPDNLAGLKRRDYGEKDKFGIGTSRYDVAFRMNSINNPKKPL